MEIIIHCGDCCALPCLSFFFFSFVTDCLRLTGQRLNLCKQKTTEAAVNCNEQFKRVRRCIASNPLTRRQILEKCLSGFAGAATSIGKQQIQGKEIIVVWAQ